MANNMRRYLRRKVEVIHKKERGNRRSKVTEEMGEITASGYSQRLFKLIWNTRGRRTSVRESVFDGNGELVYEKQRALDR